MNLLKLKLLVSFTTLVFMSQQFMFRISLPWLAFFFAVVVNGPVDPLGRKPLLNQISLSFWSMIWGIAIWGAMGVSSTKRRISIDWRAKECDSLMDTPLVRCARLLERASSQVNGLSELELPTTSEHPLRKIGNATLRFCRSLLRSTCPGDADAGNNAEVAKLSNFFCG